MSSSTLLERGSSAVAPFSSPIPGYPARFDSGRLAGERQLVRAAALHGRIRKDVDRLQDSLPLRRRSRPRHAAESLPHVVPTACAAAAARATASPAANATSRCGNCKCEYTKDGCCISCTSGDKACCAMIQECCDCLQQCCESGCCCYICFNNTPVCCGTCA